MSRVFIISILLHKKTPHIYLCEIYFAQIRRVHRLFAESVMYVSRVFFTKC